MITPSITKSMNEKEIKDKLQKLLSEPDTNYSEILSLSGELAKLDSNNVRFTIDAGIVSRLGVELVGKRETAITELIKNAYDADATEVNLIFENAYYPGGSLVITDNGHGMNMEQLINGFMRLSSSDKIHNPQSPKYKRLRAGQKGIGRFATQRLGDKLTIITQANDENMACKVTIEWNKFNTDTDLSSITSTISKIEKTQPSGTILKIDGLREGWSDAIVKKVYRCVSTLLQPFPLSQVKDDAQDPGFIVSFYRNFKAECNRIVEEKNEIYAYAVAKVDTQVNDDGSATWHIHSSHFSYDETFFVGPNGNNDTEHFSYLRNVRAQYYYFIFDKTLVPQQSLKFIQEVANESGGIRMYRKGFRVPPYADSGNDWLGLDASAQRRTIYAPHKNNSFIGFVEVDRMGDNIFEETSSREGLIQNEAYDELVKYLYTVIISSVLKISELRGRKGTSSTKDWSKKNSTIKVDNAIEDLRKIIESQLQDDTHQLNVENGTFMARAQELITSLIEARKNEQQVHNELINENNMLRVLAGTGLVIGEFIHEIKRFLPGFSMGMAYLKKHMDNETKTKERMGELEKSIKGFTAYTSYFDSSISQNVVRELQPIVMQKVINNFIRNISPDLERSGIVLEGPLYDKLDIKTCPMHPSEWLSILFNLYTNAKKAIYKQHGDSRIKIRCGYENDYVYLMFSDSGCGIKEDIRESIFNAFFTTSSPTEYENENDYSGSGLGLKIVRDVIESYNGQIFVVDAEQNYNTTFKILIPKYE